MADGGVGLRGFAAGKTVFLGEELDVENAEAVELGEEEGGGIGCGTERVFGMGGDPIGEDTVGGGKVEVVEIKVALVEAGVGEWLGVETRRKKRQKEDGGDGGDSNDLSPLL
jgi:hypothetical protein